MKEPYVGGLAIHIGSESCRAACEGGDEALTRESAGRVFSRESTLLGDADAVEVSGRPHRVHRHREVCLSPARSKTLWTRRSASRGNKTLRQAWVILSTASPPPPLRLPPPDGQ